MPVTHREAGPASQRTASATSQPVPSVPRTLSDARLARKASSTADFDATMGVWTSPGAMALTRIPCGPWWAAIAWVRLRVAPLVVA
jgi:hypothetical protein